ncbi:hypothetical protein P7K49_020595 [Saguinus oedipus]|uniref:Uncharacterized protein n=1 Tax=Saguinus oedipus TaxID=9490 RepID=A0ABQ9V0R2_SAGOE|nr:hypothetical protein P7K49_020595 [Saguinus oedipus]
MLPLTAQPKLPLLHRRYKISKHRFISRVLNTELAGDLRQFRACGRLCCSVAGAHAEELELPVVSNGSALCFRPFLSLLTAELNE